MNSIKTKVKEWVIQKNNERKSKLKTFWNLNRKDKMKSLIKSFMTRLVITALVAWTLSHFGIDPIVKFDIEISIATINVNDFKQDKIS